MTIAIIGTGLAGLVQCLALVQQGFDVTLVGPQPPVMGDDRTTAILMPGIEFLRQLGLWSQIQPSATALNTMELIDGDKHLVFDAAEIGQPSFGFNIHNDTLKQALVTAIATSGATWHKRNAVGFDRNAEGWRVTLEDNTTIDSSLLIGADGRHAATRKAANIGADEQQLDQTALVTILQTEKPHHNTSVEWYLQGGPLTLVPMPKNKLAVVWCNDTAIQQQKLQLPLTQIEQELNTLTKGRFGTVRITGKLQSWPVRPMKARALAAPHFALIGEAAHVMAPIGAQGFNTSLFDVMTLTRLLCEARDAGIALHTPQLLRRYEKTRMDEITLRWRGINTLNSLLRTKLTPLHTLRRFSLLGIRQIPFIKRQLMHKGMSQSQ